MGCGAPIAMLEAVGRRPRPPLSVQLTFKQAEGRRAAGDPFALREVEILIDLDLEAVVREFNFN